MVRERRRDVGARFHGDFQGLENWSDEHDVLDELAAGGIDATFEHHGFAEGETYDAGGRRRRVRSDRPLFYLVRRGGDEGCLDHALLRQAVAAGAEVRFGDHADTAQDADVLAIGPRLPDAIAVGCLFRTDMADGCWLVLDDRLAPRGYAYLLIHDGRGTLATCLFVGFKEHAACLDRTLAFFVGELGLRMRESRRFGGYVSFRLPRTALQGGRPVVGGQAGFQDALAGFGMRYAIRSGLLAARGIIEGKDYTDLWRRELQPLLQAGAVNRFLVNLTGKPGRGLALAMLSRGDTGHVLRRFYRPSVVSRLLFPILRYRALLRDRSCDHIDCTCVWCEHGSVITPRRRRDRDIRPAGGTPRPRMRVAKIRCAVDELQGESAVRAYLLG